MPSTDILKRFADFYEVSTDYLLEKTNILNPDTTERPVEVQATDELGLGLALHLLDGMKYEDLTETQKRAVYDFAMKVLRSAQRGDTDS